MTTISFENAFLAIPRVSDSEHFRHVLWTSFQVRFSSDFVTFLRLSGIPFGTIFQTKTIPKIVPHIQAPLVEISPLSACPMAPRDAASRTRFSTVTIARARILVRFQLELELWLEFVSKFELIAIRNRKIARKWLLELASIAKVSKTIRKMERADIKSTFLMI